MPYDALIEEAKKLTEEEILSVLDYIAFLKFKATVPASSDNNYEGWIRTPGQHGDLFQILDGFDEAVI